MPDKVTISHRGSRYEIGRGKRYYGIWVAGAPESDPVDRWPETREGWAQAWSRFVGIETPGTITAVEQPRSGFRLPPIRMPGRTAAITGARRDMSAGKATIAVALLGLGLIIGIVGLFPAYFTGQSLASQADELVAQLLYLAGWAVAGVLILRGARRGAAAGAVAAGAPGVTAPGVTAGGVTAGGVTAGGTGRRGIARTGALVGTGLSAVTLGLLLSDLGQVISGQSGLEAGMVLTLVSWVACTAGSAVALGIRSGGARVPGGASAPANAGGPIPGSPIPGSPIPGSPIPAGPVNPAPADPASPAAGQEARANAGDPAASQGAWPTAGQGNWPSAGLGGWPTAVEPGRPVRPRAEHAGPITLLALAALGTVATFVPSWDSFTLHSQTGSATVTAGNAFSQPAAAVAGDVLVMVAVVAVAVTAALWRPSRQGAALLAGAILPMVAQAISAVIQVSQPVPPGEFGLFGIAPQQAQAAGATLTSGLTPIFWVYCVFVISLVISCAWMVSASAHPATPGAVPRPPWAGPIPWMPEPSDAGQRSDESADDSGDNDPSAEGGDTGGGAESTYA